jgi:hypothetical protein
MRAFCVFSVGSVGSDMAGMQVRHIRRTPWLPVLVDTAVAQRSSMVLPQIAARAPRKGPGDAMPVSA